MKTGPDKPWFKAKGYGYGTGLPIVWQGWAVLGVLMLALAGSAQVHGGWGWALRALVLVVFLVVCAFKTEGGWRWRWGRD